MVSRSMDRASSMEGIMRSAGRNKEPLANGHKNDARKDPRKAKNMPA